MSWHVERTLISAAPDQQDAVYVRMSPAILQHVTVQLTCLPVQ